MLEVAPELAEELLLVLALAPLVVTDLTHCQLLLCLQLRRFGRESGWIERYFLPIWQRRYIAIASANHFHRRVLIILILADTQVGLGA